MIKHNLTDEQLKELDSMVKNGISRWKYMRAEDGSLIMNPQLVIDNGIIVSTKCESDHTPAQVVDEIYIALLDSRKRASEAAKKAAATRARRKEWKANEIAKRIAFGGVTGPATKCILCGKKLNDEKSIQRGIGSDCWQRVVFLAEVISKKLGAENISGQQINIKGI